MEPKLQTELGWADKTPLVYTGQKPQYSLYVKNSEGGDYHYVETSSTLNNLIGQAFKMLTIEQISEIETENKDPEDWFFIHTHFPE